MEADRRGSVLGGVDNSADVTVHTQTRDVPTPSPSSSCFSHICAAAGLVNVSKQRGERVNAGVNSVTGVRGGAAGRRRGPLWATLFSGRRSGRFC